MAQSDDFQKHYQTISRAGFDKADDLPFKFKTPAEFDVLDKFLLNCRKISHSYFFDSNPLDLEAGDKGAFVLVVTEWRNQDLLLIPIESRQHRLGFLVVRDPVDRIKPNEDKIISLEYYANQAAVAIENASLYENLQISEERYRALAETMTLGLVTCSPEGKIIYVNPAFEKLVGFSKRNLLRQTLSSYFSEESKIKLTDFAEQVMHPKERKKREIENTELELIAATGEVIPVSTYTFPFSCRRGGGRVAALPRTRARGRGGRSAHRG